MKGEEGNVTEKIKGTCMECGKRGKVWQIREELVLCDDCADELDWIQCDICGDFYPWDDVEFTELEDGRKVCEYCMEDL